MQASLMVAALIGASGPVSAPAPVHAQHPAPERRVAGTCTFGWVCGRIVNRDPHVDLMITNDWGHYRDRRTWRIVHPRSTGRDAGVKDVDGFYVGQGCRVQLGWVRWIGPGWYKIRDGQYIVVSDIRCHED